MTVIWQGYQSCVICNFNKRQEGLKDQKNSKTCQDLKILNCTVRHKKNYMNNIQYALFKFVITIIPFVFIEIIFSGLLWIDSSTNKQ